MIIANIHNATTPKKIRVAEVFKNKVYKDIDLATHKHAEGSGVQDVKVLNALSSDSTESVDGAILSRLVEARDAKIRKRIRFALAPKHQVYANDALLLDKDRYTYRFILPESWDDNTLESLAEFIHRYLVWGSLADWYGEMGSAQSSWYESQLSLLEQEIADMLREPSIVSPPMQPFGPARNLL